MTSSLYIEPQLLTISQQNKRNLQSTMAYHQVDYLQKVALDGFSIIEKQYGRGNQRHTPPPPPPPAGRQGQYHHQKLAPNQYQMPYSYQEPQAYDTEKEPDFRSYRPATKQQGYETWYFVPVPQAPIKGGPVISSSEAAETYGGILFMDYGYKSKPYRWGCN
ncbi:Uncharacterized protein TCM_021256 [Theobroma cacao]|uniref:Uncharacterized protein n=1 Tax=Theobroma cacao TaxID=3641 RepID=A0A061ENF8_THECC|nr:Uncharacterized protein TCM_021256 [Theobroma cacao]